MSEQINKVLASTAQAFSTAQQKQARDNISAQAKISYSYSGSTITAIDGSAVGNPASLTGVEHDYNLSGSGTSAEPLGLSSTIKLENSLSATKIGPAYVSAANHVGTAYMAPNQLFVNTQAYLESAQLLGGRLTFWDTATSERVDMSSIQRWNSYSSCTASRETYGCNVYGLTGSDSVYDWEQTSAYPSGTDYDWRMDFVVHGTGNGYVVVVTDSTAGTTADLRTGESAAIFYSHTASAWIGQTGTHSM